MILTVAAFVLSQFTAGPIIKTPICIDDRAEDVAGRALIYELKDAIRGSNSFELVYQLCVIKVAIRTADVSALAKGRLSVVGITFLAGKVDHDEFIDSTVTIVTTGTEKTIARETMIRVAELDEELMRRLYGKPRR